MGPSWGMCGHVVAKLGYQSFEWVLRAMWAPPGGQVQPSRGRVGHLIATLMPSWGQLSMLSFWAMLFLHNEKGNPKIQLRNALPPGPEDETESNQITTPKHKNSAKMLSLMAVKAQRNQTSKKSIFKTLSPVALQPQRLARQPKLRPPLAELYEMTMFLRNLPARRQEHH